MMDRLLEVISALRFAIPLFLAAWVSKRVLETVDYRLELIESGAVSKKHGSIAETLWVCEGESPSNRDFRHNVYWAGRAMTLIAMTPLLILWAASLDYLAEGQGCLGAGLSLFGTALFLAVYGAREWRSRGWRLNSVFVFQAAWFLTLVFAPIAALYVESFGAVTFAFGTLSLMPLALQVMEFNLSLTKATTSLKEALGKASEDSWALSDCYSANSDEQVFDFVQDVSGSLCGFANRSQQELTEARRSLALTWSSRVILLVYVLVSLKTDMGLLALLNALLILVFDQVHVLLARNASLTEVWSPTKTVGLMALSRLLISILNGPRLWAVGHSTAFFLYGLALAAAIVDRQMPLTSTNKAASMLFRSLKEQESKVGEFDVGGFPEVVLGVVAFCFFFQVVVVSYVEKGQRVVSVGKGDALPVYAWSVVSGLAVCSSGLLMASVRATYLSGQDLLLGPGNLAYLLAPRMRLPRILGVASYWTLLCLGLYVWAETSAVSALVTVALAPLVLLCLLRSSLAFFSNGGRVVVWPPRDHKRQHDHESDADLALGLLQAIIPPKKVQVEELKGEIQLQDEESSHMRKMPLLPPSATMEERCRKQQAGELSIQQTSAPAVLRVQRRDMGFRELRVSKKKEDEEDEQTMPSLRPQEVVRLLVQWAISKNHAPSTNRSRNWVAEMPLWEAVLTGCLLPYEFEAFLAAWMSPLLLCVLGGLLSLSLEAGWIGGLVTLAGISSIASLAPLFHYHMHAREWTLGMRLSLGLGVLAYLGLIAQVFLILEGIYSYLWLADSMLFYPAAGSALFEVLSWADRGWRLKEASKASRRSLAARRSRLTFACLLAAQLAIVHVLAAVTVLIGIAVVAARLKLLEDWSREQFYVTHTAVDAKWHRRAALIFLVLACFFDASICLSLAFCLEITAASSAVLAEVLNVPAHSIFCFSPALLPAYSNTDVDPRPVDRSALVLKGAGTVGLGLCWGSTMALFRLPAGVYVLCAWALLGVLSLVYATTRLAHDLGLAAELLPTQLFVQSATKARDNFFKEQQPSRYLLRCPQWETLQKKKKKKKRKQKDRHEIFKTLESEAMGEEASMGAGDTTEEEEEEDSDVEEEEEEVMMSESAAALAARRRTAKTLLFHCEEGEMWRHDGLFETRDALAEMGAGRGPFWSLSRLIRRLKGFDHRTGRRRLTSATCAALEARISLRSLLDLEASFEARFQSETQCCAMFQLLLMRQTLATLKDETLRLRRFVRSQRFKLLAHGVLPPAESVDRGDLRSLANWLQVVLTREQRDRFRLLQAEFADQEAFKEGELDSEDALLVTEVARRRKQRLPKEREGFKKHSLTLQKRRQTRLRRWQSNLSEVEKQCFLEREKLWEEGHVELEGAAKDLYEAYDLHVLLNGDESRGCAREHLSELEAGEYDCVPLKGSNGFKQFQDPEFVKERGWESAMGLAAEASLFGTGQLDFEGITNGKQANEWLITAMRLLARSSEFAVKELFVHTTCTDGEAFTVDSAVGAFAVRLYVNGQWEYVIVDDALPMEEGAFAVAHSSHTQLWVPLLEKAVAKYYGGYASIAEGSVEEALELLTGGEASCLPMGPSMTRGGAHREAFWSMLLGSRRSANNNFALGARSLPREFADASVRDMQSAGLELGAVYAVLEVTEVDGERLVELGAPHRKAVLKGGEWAPDRWTPRLRHRLLRKGDPTAFWVSFDGFCAAFRSLYVCKNMCFFNNEKKKPWEFSGGWTAPSPLQPYVEDTAAGLPTPLTPSASIERNPQYLIHVRRRPLSRLRIELRQVNGRGLASEQALPVSLFLTTTTADDPTSVGRVASLEGGNVLATTGDPKISRRVDLEIRDLQPGFYVLLCGLYEPQLEGAFSLTFVSDYDCHVDQLWPPPWRALTVNPPPAALKRPRGLSTKGPAWDSQLRMIKSDSDPPEKEEAALDLSLLPSEQEDPAHVSDLETGATDDDDEDDQRRRISLN